MSESIASQERSSRRATTHRKERIKNIADGLSVRVASSVCASTMRR